MDPASPLTPGTAPAGAFLARTVEHAHARAHARPYARNEAFRNALVGGSDGRLGTEPKKPPSAHEPARDEGPTEASASGRAKTRRSTLADAPEDDPSPFLPLPGIVRPVRLAPLDGSGPSRVDPAAELAALVDRAVESLRIGRSSRGPEAHLRMRAHGARNPLEVRLVAEPGGAIEARILAAPEDRGIAEALARNLGSALADQNACAASISVELA